MAGGGGLIPWPPPIRCQQHPSPKYNNKKCLQAFHNSHDSGLVGGGGGCSQNPGWRAAGDLVPVLLTRAKNNVETDA